MAEYCAPEDLAIYGVNAAAIEDVSVDENQKPPIQAASDVIDSYLRSRYTLPLASWGKDIRQCCAVLAACQILGVRGLKPGENPEDNWLLRQCEEKTRWLEQIAAGRVSPNVKDASSEATGVSPARPFFQSNTQRGYQVDEGTTPLAFQGGRR